MRKLAQEGIAIGESLLDGAKITTAQGKLDIEFTSDKDLKDVVKIFSTMLFLNAKVSVGTEPIEGARPEADKIEIRR